MRLLAAANARIEWVNILRNSLLAGDTSAGTIGYPPAAFRDAALAAYEGIEAPCQVVSSTRDLFLLPSTNGRRQVSPTVPVSEAPRTRKRVTLGLAHAPSTGPILFEDRSTSPHVTVKLVCIDCTRSDFPTIQGFLNHCRLAHSRVYGTHDECIQETGVVVETNERENLLASGVEINTVHLPSIRGMFERAVGLATDLAPAGTAELLVDESSGPSTHLSQTLGFHKDTPTLAPFLGKKVKKKCIHVYDNSEPIDIISCDDNPPPSTRPPCVMRNRAMRKKGDEPSIYLLTLASEKTSDTEALEHISSDPLDGQASRFHVTRRVLVTDRSLYLPEDKRHPVSHTHRWQLSVSAPSYSQDITTFLSRLIVTCVTKPPIFTTPITVSAPPFVACSTSDRPFLARLTFEWVGEKNHAFHVDHWVELDQLKAARPVLGEEQLFDVELDRTTIFLPVCNTAAVVSWHAAAADDDRREGRVDGMDDSVPGSEYRDIAHRQGTSDLEHTTLLKSIVPRFPIGIETRQPRGLPYMLYPSRTSLLALLPGRRKAIEWGRARAIRTEYDSIPTSGDKFNLTTGDVYRWLEKEGHFPRPRTESVRPLFQAAAVPSPNPTSQTQSLNASQQFCPVCGVDIHRHTPSLFLISQEPLNVGERDGFRCPFSHERRRAPIVHVYALLAPPGMPYWVYQAGQVTFTPSTPHDLVTVAHPHLTRFVRHNVALLSLPRFEVAPALEGNAGLFTGNELSLGNNRREVDEALAPHALLAITLERLVKDLVESGVQVAREMQNRTKAASVGTREPTATSLLTPTHVLQGLLINNTDPGRPKEALFKCFSRVGTVLVAAGAQKPNNFRQQPK
ncbi:hypothetical protein K439DRAFT_120063 [Ramaria rubella]|nr:hypothetical protein K439DRAFT_120063 [Ramaria rubella]